MVWWKEAGVLPVPCSHIAVAHHQCAELLSIGQQLLDAVRQLAQNRIRNGVGVIAIGIEIAALDHRIGDRARAIAEQGIKGAAGDLDRTVPIDSELMPALTLWKVPPLILPLVIVSRPFPPNSPPVILALVISTGQLMGPSLSLLKSKSAPP